MSVGGSRADDRRPDLDDAARRGDVTIAFTPGQLLLIALAAMLLLRFLRRLRATGAEARAGRHG